MLLKEVEIFVAPTSPGVADWPTLSCAKNHTTISIG